MADDRRENLNTFLALLHKPAKLVPCTNARYSGGGRALSGDLQNVPERIGMETRHRAEIRGQSLALARLKLLNEVVHGLLDELLLREQGVDLSPKIQGRQIRLLDATVVSEPGKTGSQWRVHYSLVLPTLECDHFVLTSTTGTGVSERFGQFRFSSSDLVLADAGYSNPPGILAIVEQDADVCVRLNPHSLPLYDGDGKRLKLSAELSQIASAGTVAEWPLWVHAGERKIPGRLTAIRKSKEAIRRADVRLKDKQQRGKKVGPLTRLCAQYVLVFTTLSTQQASAERVLEMYRLRWQIELSFKRLKSIADLGHLPKYDERSSRAWLYGKLFLALLTEKMTRVARTISPWGYGIKKAEDDKQMA